MLIDSHCHLHFPELKDKLPKLVQDMNDLQISKAITVCTELSEINDITTIVNQYPCIFASVGIHPNVDKNVECDIDEIQKLIEANDKFIAVGECGLDFYYHDKQEVYAWQAKRFNLQIELALKMNLPLIVHSRESISDSIKELTPALKQGLKAVLHCYTGTWEEAKQALDIGLMLSFTGVITYKKAKDLAAVAKNTPIDRLMLETDAPYLSPAPSYRKPNDPTNLRLILDFLAKERNMDPEELANIATKNTNEFFNLPN